MEATMLRDSIYPKTKQDLIKTLHHQRILQIEVMEPYEPIKDQDLNKLAKTMFNRPGDVTIIMLRTQ